MVSLYREAYQPNSNLKVSAIKMTTTVCFVELVEASCTLDVLLKARSDPADLT